jgi:hypothetical protein
MIFFGFSDGFGEIQEDWGFFTDRKLAEKVLKIIQMSVDESADLIKSEESDPWADQIRAGLLPWKISAEIFEGRITKNHVELTWPPSETEGITEDREDYREYFCWAASSGEAIGKLARFSIGNQRERIAALEAV